MQLIIKRVPIIIARLIGGWLLQQIGVIQGFQVGLVVTIILAIGVLWFQQKFYVEQPVERPPRPFIILTFSFFALLPLVFTLYSIGPQDKFTLFLILAFIIAGLREVGEPARKGLITDSDLCRGGHVRRGRDYLVCLARTTRIANIRIILRYSTSRP